MAESGKGFWSSFPGILTGIAGVIAAVGGLIALFNKPPPQPPFPSPPPIVTPGPQPPQPDKMGRLQEGINYDQADLPGERQTASAEACAELCLETPQCMAMTYVKSLRGCWLKSRVPASLSGTDYVSSVRHISGR